MANFGHLKAKKKDFVEYTFHNVVGEPTLFVRCAGEDNKPYFNELLRQAEHHAKRKAKLNVDLIQGNRTRDLELYPKFVVTGWHETGEHAVRDDKGVAVPFTQADCKSFLEAVGDEEFDTLREFCRDTATNFRESSASPEAAAGNSPTA